MSRKNRTNYSNKYNPEPKEETVEEIADETVEEEAFPVEEDPKPTIVKVSIPQECTLNIRKDPEVSSEVLAELTNGTEVEILDDTFKDWFKIVTTFGIEGYIKKDYVEFV